MTNSESPLISIHDSKKSLLSLYPDSVEPPLILYPDSALITYQDNNTHYINDSRFLITFPSSHESLIEHYNHESLIIEQDIYDNDVIMCTECNNFPSIFKIYKKFAPFTNSWLNYYNNNDNNDCKHKVWRKTRYVCEKCVVKYENSDKFIKIIF